MSQADEERQPRGTAKEIPVRSVRISDELWMQFVARCLTEKPPRTASAVLKRFITDYVSGALKMPVMYPLYGDDVIIDLRDYDPDEDGQQ